MSSPRIRRQTALNQSRSPIEGCQFLADTQRHSRPSRYLTLTPNETQHAHQGLYPCALPVILELGFVQYRNQSPQGWETAQKGDPIRIPFPNRPAEQPQNQTSRAPNIRAAERFHRRRLRKNLRELNLILRPNSCLSPDKLPISTSVKTAAISSTAPLKPNCC